VITELELMLQAEIIKLKTELEYYRIEIALQCPECGLEGTLGTFTGEGNCLQCIHFDGDICRHSGIHCEFEKYEEDNPAWA